MNRWEDRLYLLPDDQCVTLDRLLCGLPEEHAVNMVPQIECLMLVGLSENDELVLHLGVDGIKVCEGGIALVPFGKRKAVEEALPMLGQSTTDWLEVHRVSGEPDALQAFEVLWEQLSTPVFRLLRSLLGSDGSGSQSKVGRSCWDEAPIGSLATVAGKT